MEIRDPIHGYIELTREEMKIIDTREFQRLRAIKQLGFSEYSFPGATHNRYLHSIGVCHLAGRAFDSVFIDHRFSSEETRRRMRQSVRLAALLHDIGHGPLSHAIEEVMPPLSELGLKVYAEKAQDNCRATHEDYTVKFIMESSLTEALKRNFQDIDPWSIACLVDKSLPAPRDSFIDGGVNLRPVLSQIVSSEMDVDRMDYLERDAYFCGTNYGKVELNWLISNLTFHIHEGAMHLALNRRALYTFDDFLLARHHMHLMVYFHHKSIVFEEMLYRYLVSTDCQFRVPADIEGYIEMTDYRLHEHLSRQLNPWAKRVAERKPFRMLFELHTTEDSPRQNLMRQALETEGIEVIAASSMARLSKYHGPSLEDQATPIFVVDHMDLKAQPYPIEQSTQIFQKYEEIRRIERIYVAPEDYDRAKAHLIHLKL